MQLAAVPFCTAALLHPCELSLTEHGPDCGPAHFPGLQAEQEHRRQQLLQRARQKYGVSSVPSMHAPNSRLASAARRCRVAPDPQNPTSVCAQCFAGSIAPTPPSEEVSVADCHLLAALQTEESSSDVAAVSAPAASKEPATEQPVPITAAVPRSKPESGKPLAAAEAPAGDSAVVMAVDEGKGLLQHINFWQQDELRLEHPEVQVGACQCGSCRSCRG